MVWGSRPMAAGAKVIQSPRPRKRAVADPAGRWRIQQRPSRPRRMGRKKAAMPIIWRIASAIHAPTRPAQLCADPRNSAPMRTPNPAPDAGDAAYPPTVSAEGSDGVYVANASKSSPAHTTTTRPRISLRRRLRVGVETSLSGFILGGTRNPVRARTHANRRTSGNGYYEGRDRQSYSDYPRAGAEKEKSRVGGLRMQTHGARMASIRLVLAALHIA